MTNREKLDLILAIVKRAEPIAGMHGVRLDRLTSILDLENADKQYPLDLEAMLTADGSDFAHDFFGIRSHMNRETGLLEDCFTPRFAKQGERA